MSKKSDKRDAKRYRFIKKLAEARTSSTDAHFRIVVRKEYGGGLFGKPSKVTNYRTVNGAVDRMMRDSRRK